MDVSRENVIGRYLRNLAAPCLATGAGSGVAILSDDITAVPDIFVPSEIFFSFDRSVQ